MVTGNAKTAKRTLQSAIAARRRASFLSFLRRESPRRLEVQTFLMRSHLRILSRMLSEWMMIKMIRWNNSNRQKIIKVTIHQTFKKDLLTILKKKLKIKSIIQMKRGNISMKIIPEMTIKKFRILYCRATYRQ